MVFNMPLNTFLVYYVGYFVQAAIVVAIGVYCYIKDAKQN